jgi:hypothetical protein
MLKDYQRNLVVIVKNRKIYKNTLSQWSSFTSHEVLKEGCHEPLQTASVGSVSV